MDWIGLGRQKWIRVQLWDASQVEECRHLQHSTPREQMSLDSFFFSRSFPS